jgi:hypothetical protein
MEQFDANKHPDGAVSTVIVVSQQPVGVVAAAPVTIVGQGAGTLAGQIDQLAGNSGMVAVPQAAPVGGAVATVALPVGAGTPVVATAVPVAGAGEFCAGCGVPHPTDGAKFCTVRAPSARVRALRIRTAIMRTRACRAVAPRWL